MLEVRKSKDRGFTELDWLKSYHTFSFAEYFDAKQIGFSDLFVINDDYIGPSGGFGTHPHRNMEIFTYVISGRLEHKDSMGNGSVIEAGDVQTMSAGTGVEHSEFNPSKDKTVHLLQIWIVPNVKGVTPRYQQNNFNPADKRGKLRPIISENGIEGSLKIYQNAIVYAGLLDGAEKITYPLPADRFAYVHVVRGSLDLNGQSIEAGDGVRVREESVLTLSKGKDAEVLVFDLAPKDLPDLRRSAH